MQLRYSTPFLTTYDLVKTLALILMILDHIGYFFYPDNLWFRAVGRASFPIWCFLIGYANSRNTGKDIWSWATILLVFNLILGGPLLPLNILYTIIAVRLVLDRMASVVFRHWEVMLYAVIALSVLTWPTMAIIEYGALGLLLALCGYAVRHQESLGVSIMTQRSYILFVTTFYFLIQNFLFQFPDAESKTAAFSIGVAILMMCFFKPLNLVGWTERLPRPVTGMLQFSGRYTMEIYVIHLILFKLAAALLHLEGYGFFAPRLIV
jgi:hypothetical protein